MLIYCATNIVNGKKYIGQTTKSLDHRIKGHLHATKNKKLSVFCKALLKYGVNGFEWVILCKCKSTSDMNKKEKYFIKLYNTYKSKFGYNMSPGVQYHTDHSKKLISESVSKSLMGHKLTEDTKRKISKSHIGYKHTDEAKLKMSKGHIGKKTWNTGIKLTEEHKNLIKNSSFGKKKPGTSIYMKARWEKYRKMKSEENTERT